MIFFDEVKLHKANEVEPTTWKYVLSVSARGVEIHTARCVGLHTARAVWDYTQRALCGDTLAVIFNVKL